MDTKMTPSPTWTSGDADVATAATAPRDDEVNNTNNILEDKYFKPDMSDEAMNSLLDCFEPMDTDPQSVKQSPNLDDTANMSPQPINSIEQFSLEDTSPLSATSSNSSVVSYQQADGLPMYTMPNLTALPMRPHSPQSFDHSMMMQQHGAHFTGPRIYGTDHYYQSLSPVQPMPTFHGTFSPQYRYPSPYQSQSRQATVDLMDYGQSIPEDDEYGDEVEGAESADPCYAQLLYRCLREAPDHTLSLKDLYSWVAQHSQKAKDSSSKGWQNSVRHNLSMNAAFERVTASSLGPSAAAANKKGSLWHLTESALHRGVISTTRYRKDPKRKPERRSSPALKRQLSGAKGGQATRAASQHRRAMQARSKALHQSMAGRQHRGFFGAAPTSMPSSVRPSPQMGFQPQPPSPYFLPMVDNGSFAFTSQPTLENLHSHSHTPSPHTPPQIPVVYDNGASKGFLADFELGHISHEDRRLFGNDDVEFGAPDTPYSEGSFFTDEVGSLGRASCEPIC